MNYVLNLQNVCRNMPISQATAAIIDKYGNDDYLRVNAAIWSDSRVAAYVDEMVSTFSDTESSVNCTDVEKEFVSTLRMCADVFATNWGPLDNLVHAECVAVSSCSVLDRCCDYSDYLCFLNTLRDRTHRHEYRSVYSLASMLLKHHDLSKSIRLWLEGETICAGNSASVGFDNLRPASRLLNDFPACPEDGLRASWRLLANKSLSISLINQIIARIA